VAENQPAVEQQNRMTSELSKFTARLREFIRLCHREHAKARTPTTGVQHPGRPGDASVTKQFNSLALELFALQFAHNAPYRRLCEARGVSPRSVTDWMQIPAAPTAAFKEFEMTCLPVAERTAVFHSSGTTEQRPGRHFHNAESLALYEASLLPWFERHVAPDFGLRTSDFGLALLTPPPSQAPHSSLVHMFETVRRAFGALDSAFVGKVGGNGAWTLDFAAALSRLRQSCETNRPLILLGTAFSFVHLLDALVARDLLFELPAGSRVMETGGYKGRSRSLTKSKLHALVTERLGIPETHIVSEYGMSELSSQAYDAEVRSAKCEVRSFHFPPWARAQIVSPESGREVGEGETGLIRVFDLANVFSVMAIQTEDLGIHRRGGFELIGRAQLAEPRGCSLMSVETPNP
jgi:hypothetical protein